MENKTVPVYLDNDTIGYAEIGTMQNVPSDNGARILDIWTISNIRIDLQFKHIVKHCLYDHGYKLYTVIDSDKFHGVAITIGYPNKDLAVDKTNTIHPFTIESITVSYEVINYD